MRISSIAILAMLCGSAGAATLELKTLSTRADYVSGDDVLIEVIAPSGTHAANVAILLNGKSAAVELKGVDGRFSGLLGGLKPGKVTFRTFSMSARRPGILRLERNGVEVQGGIEVQPNEEVLGLRLILAPSNGVIRGRVTIQGGPLPKGAEVVALARPVNNDQPDIGDTYRRVDVSSTGAFLIENLTPGTYEVQVTSSVPRQSGSRSVSSKQTVTVTGSSPVEVDIVLDLSGKGSDK